MSRRAIPPDGRLVISAIYRSEEAFDALVPLLAGRFGPVESISGRFRFDFTEYYADEMGEGLSRRFVVMRDAVRRDALAAIKIEAEALEGALAAGGRRTVNIDPALLSEENFVLATGKNYSHRVYLRDGVYADLALVYSKGAYRALPWTYPDYASEEIRDYLAGVRRAFREARGGDRGETPCG